MTVSKLKYYLFLSLILILGVFSSCKTSQHIEAKKSYINSKLVISNPTPTNVQNDVVVREYVSIVGKKCKEPNPLKKLERTKQSINSAKHNAGKCFKKPQLPTYTASKKLNRNPSSPTYITAIIFLVFAIASFIISASLDFDFVASIAFVVIGICLLLISGVILLAGIILDLTYISDSKKQKKIDLQKESEQDNEIPRD
ncbi:MAG: hypothetical protein SGJ04_03630 [Bacteroidota bacterium]|nr:hypothetical protein [Bacteroidota bacterium]